MSSLDSILNNWVRSWLTSRTLTFSNTWISAFNNLIKTYTTEASSLNKYLKCIECKGYYSSRKPDNLLLIKEIDTHLHTSYTYWSKDNRDFKENENDYMIYQFQTEESFKKNKKKMVKDLKLDRLRKFELLSKT